MLSMRGSIRQTGYRELQQKRNPALMADWAELPGDIVGLITSFLPLKDYIRLGAVCRSWSSVAAGKHHPPSQQLPWLVLGDDMATKTRMFYNSSEQKIYHIDIPEAHDKYCASSNYGWLVTVDLELNINLLNPFNRAKIQLPFLRPDYCDDEGDVSDEDSSSWRLSDEIIQRMHIYKIILSADPGISSDYVVAAVYGDTQSLAFWKPGEADWIKLGKIEGRWEDAIWYKGALYAVTPGNAVYSFDLQAFPPKVKQQSPHFYGFRCYLTRYLVEFMGDLLLIPRKVGDVDDDGLHKTRSVSVLKFENTTQKWIQLESIGDYVLFLGRNGPICVSASDFPGCEKNSIYFTDDFDIGVDTYGCEDLLIYSLKDGNMKPYYPIGDFPHTIFQPLWLQPNPW